MAYSTEVQETSRIFLLKASCLLFSTQDFQLLRQENEFRCFFPLLFNKKVTLFLYDLLDVTVVLENITTSLPEKRSIVHNIPLSLKCLSDYVYTAKSQVEIHSTWYIENWYSGSPKRKSITFLISFIYLWTIIYLFTHYFTFHMNSSKSS